MLPVNGYGVNQGLRQSFEPLAKQVLPASQDFQAAKPYG
jgi:hypothetical protein